MGKLIMTVAIEFDDTDDSLNLTINTDVDGELNGVDAATALFFKKSLEFQAEHTANQAVDYADMVRSVFRAAEGDDWED